MRFKLSITIITFIVFAVAIQSTSNYKRVSWDAKRKLWLAELSFHGKIYKSYFENELDASKQINQLCKNFGISSKNFELPKITNQETKQISHKGFYWHEGKRKWVVLLYLKNQISKYGGYFKEKLDAVKRVNELCEELGIPLKHPELSSIPTQKMEQTSSSHFKGVYWHKKSNKWYAYLQLNSKKQKFGGRFKNELDAAKRVNQLCVEMEIPLKNPEVIGIPTQQNQKSEKISQYKGVCWHKNRRKWIARLNLNGQQKYGGIFNDELDAAKKINQLCEKLRIPLQNPGIHKYKKKEKTSSYNGVSWCTSRRKWYAQLKVKDQIQKFGGYFKNELDAAKKVNQLCQEIEIPLKNPKISAIPTQQYQENCETSVIDYVDIQAEIEYLIKILDKNNDPAEFAIIRETLISVVRSGEKIKMTEINLQTKNGESALSIAAKHGFSHIVQFLISNGANKEHFTNEHHTPLSLAVNQNHFNVVEVLLEEWISPNSHEKPYLHLSPIFNVKSRKIAQLLVDNDAVTSGLYNNKNQSPLTVACQNGFLDVVEFFLDDGLDINHLDSDAKTPLFYARANGHQQVVNLLISKGACETVSLVDKNKKYYCF